MQTDLENLVVGEFARGAVNHAGKRLREVAAKIHFKIADTFYPALPTFYGPIGASSWPDHILMPAGLLGWTKRVFAMGREGRKLQLIPTRERRDHIPLATDFDYMLPFLANQRQNKQHTRWDWETISLCWMKGAGRFSFLTELDQRLKQNQNEIAEHHDDPTVDMHHEKVQGVISEVAAKHFGKGKAADKNEAFTTYDNERWKLVRERARARAQGAPTNEQLNATIAALTSKVKQITTTFHKRLEQCWMTGL